MQASSAHGFPRALKIAFFHAYPHQYAGAQRVTQMLASRYRQRGHHVSVVLPDEGPFAQRLRAADIPVLVVKAPAPWRRYGGALDERGGAHAMAVLGPYWLRLQRQFRRLAPDVVHCNDHRGILLAGVPARMARAAVVWHVHGTYERAWLNALGARLAHRTVVVSNATLAEMPDITRVARGRVSVIPNAVPPLEEPAPEAVAVVAAGGPPMMACGARINPEKGLDVLLRAAALLQADFPGMRTVVLGNVQQGYESYADDLHALAHELGISDHVDLAGFVEDPAPVWAAADVYVQPSRAEPFGLAVLEAMRLGTPVVTSDVGGMRDTVGHGVSGLKVAPDNPAELAAAVRRVLVDQALRDQLIAGGHRRVEEFTEDRMVKRFEDVYANALGPAG